MTRYMDRTRYLPVKGMIGEAYRMKQYASHTLRDGIYVYGVPSEIKAAWEREIAECPSCISGTPVKHGTTSFGIDGRMFTYQCRSFSRRINPQTGEIEGHRHCTCDGCF